jgi:hypothetical protein
VWIIDGTFKSAPKIYKSKGQLYTIHGLKQERDGEGRMRQETFPLVYSVLPDKRKLSYEDLFKSIIQISKCVLAPRYIILDFEIAAIDALKQCFPKTKIRGCWFHLNQSVFRKAQELGFQSRF